ncbi:NAD(P)/FAD-dependent oxidoreductase [Sneathiella glossodoripedis]|uniref:NAD(P)/FAD-dependent oxidoreductase n=1 Tax=Sneathiella glossodoripedis TaxID=418853 RepID=UPI00047107FB|nr:FAD-binding oxidoreductase [Sneathiella glossodoripedis]
MKHDVVIIGGGVVGSAIAYFLSKFAGSDTSIAVIEKDSSYQFGSTARSAGGIRQQFSTPENIRISQFAVEFLRDISTHLGIDGEKVDVSFTEGGYLFLAKDHQIPVLYNNHEIQKRENVPVALLDPEDLAKAYPWMNVSDLAGGSVGLEGEGWLDAYGLNQAFRKKAISQGVSYVKDEVTALTISDGKITSATLASGACISGGQFVNAAGAYADQIAKMAGIELEVRSKKRFVYSFSCREEIERCPLTIDPSGVYFRPEGHQFITGCSPTADKDPDCRDFDVDYGWFEEHIWPVLAHRVKVFEAIKLENAWAGHYAYTLLDQNAVLGPHPEISNFYFANGFSGHGLQQSPAVGRAIAELLLFNEYRTLDLSCFKFERLINGSAVREINVV